MHSVDTVLKFECGTGNFALADGGTEDDIPILNLPSSCPVQDGRTSQSVPSGQSPLVSSLCSWLYNCTLCTLVSTFSTCFLQPPPFFTILLEAPTSAPSHLSNPLLLHLPPAAAGTGRNSPVQCDPWHQTQMLIGFARGNFHQLLPGMSRQLAGQLGGELY